MADEDGDDVCLLGPFSKECGLTMLDLTNPVAWKVFTIKIGLVLELIDNIPSHNPKEARDLLLALTHPDSAIHRSKPESLRQKIAKAVKKRKDIKRNKPSSLLTFLNEEFVPPVTPPPPPPPPPPVKRTYTELEQDNEDCKKELQHADEECKQVQEQLALAVEKSNKLNQELEKVVREHNNALAANAKDCKKLTRENIKLQKSFDTTSSEVDTVNIRVHTLREKMEQKSACIRALRQQITRDGVKDEKRVKRIKELEDANTAIQKQVTEKDEHIQVNTDLLESARRDRRAVMKNLSQAKIRAEQSKCDLVKENQAKIQEMQDKSKENNEHILELQQLNVLLEADLIKTFENGRFVNEMRETIMILLTECNVSMSKVGKVVSTVCKNLLGKLPERLPSNGTLHRILNEAKFVAQTQIYQCLEEGGDPSNLTGNTLHSDATTKFHHHYQGFQTTLRDGKQMTLGMVEVGSGDANTYMEAFKSVIGDIAEAVTGTNSDKAQSIANLVTSLKNTMGDQGPTNPQFNSQVKEFREQLLPKVVDKWESLDTKSQEAIADMGNYFCKMHLLVNFATESDKVLKINEADIIAAGKNPYAFGSESGAARLIRTTAKALTEHGCDMSGVSSHWLRYLEELSINNYLVSYRANRFNILFYDAAATYFHRHHIFDFISSLPDPNNLLKAVLYDVQQKIYLSHIRALGMVDKVITGPFWRLVEGTSSILDLNGPLLHMLETLKKWSVDATPLLEQEPLFHDVDIHKDPMYDELFADQQDADFDTYTQVALEMVLTGIVLILERQAKDQLEGGKYFNPTPTLQESAKNVPTTNTVSERDFAILDILVRLKPAASCHAYEIYILWLNNKPSEWLNQMDPVEKSALLDKARHRYGSIRAQYLERKEKLKQQHLESLRAKQSKKDKQEHRSIVNKVAATDAIVEFGGVWKLDEVERKLESLSTQKRKAALIAQLKYHKKVLNSKGDHKLFNKSRHGVDFQEETLIDNLKTVLELNEITTETVQEGTIANLQYHTQEKSKSNVQQSKINLHEKLATQRKQLKAKQQQTLLPQLCEEPHTLVGKNVTHRTREDDGTVEWFSAKVTDMGAKKANVLNTVYTIVYDDFQEDTYYFPLLMDLKKGDLIIKN